MDAVTRRIRDWTDTTGVSEAARLVRRELAKMGRADSIVDSMFSHYRANRRSPSLPIAVAIERASSQWEHGPIRADEWVRRAPAEPAPADELQATG